LDSENSAYVIIEGKVDVFVADKRIASLAAGDFFGSVRKVVPEFFTYMVAKMGKADKIELAELRNRFKEIDATGDGFITKEDLELAHEQHMAKSEALAADQGRKHSRLALDSPQPTA